MGVKGLGREDADTFAFGPANAPSSSKCADMCIGKDKPKKKKEKVKRRDEGYCKQNTFARHLYNSRNHLFSLAIMRESTSQLFQVTSPVHPYKAIKT